MHWIIALLSLLLSATAYAAAAPSTTLQRVIRTAPPTSGYTLVAGPTCNDGTSSSATTSGINTTGANFIVLWAAIYDNGGGITLSDNLKNVAPTCLTSYGSTSHATGQFCYLYAPAVGAGHTFTLSASSQYPTLCAMAFSGAAASPADQEAGTQANSGTSIQPGAVTPTQDNELIVSGVATQAAGSASIGSGFTYVVGGGVGSINAGVGYLIQGTAAEVNPTWSWDDSADNASAIETFK